MEKTYLLTSVPNGDSDQTAQSDLSLRCPHEETLHSWISKMRNEDSNETTVKTQTDLHLRTCPKIHFLAVRLQSSSHVLGRKSRWGDDSTAVSSWLKYSCTIRSHTDRLSVTTQTCAVEQCTRWYIPILRGWKYIQTMHDPYSLSVALSTGTRLYICDFYYKMLTYHYFYI